MWPFKRKNTDSAEETYLSVLSILSPADQITTGGLPLEAIAGAFPSADPQKPDGKLDPADFRPNRAFATFMHDVIRTFGPEIQGLQEAAKDQGDGSVSVIDLRTPEGPQGAVPLEDIVGIFAVKEGCLGDYYPNEKHILYSDNGLVKLPQPLHEIHIRELKKLRVEPTSPRAQG